MATFTLAGDGSGDVSMSFGKGASRNFELTMIATQYPEELRNNLEVVGNNANLPRNYEFKLHFLTSARLRHDVFMALLQMDFSIWAVIADKTCLPTSFQKMLRIDFYLYLVAELLSVIPAIQVALPNRCSTKVRTNDSCWLLLSGFEFGF